MKKIIILLVMLMLCGCLQQQPIDDETNNEPSVNLNEKENTSNKEDLDLFHELMTTDVKSVSIYKPLVMRTCKTETLVDEQVKQLQTMLSQYTSIESYDLLGSEFEKAFDWHGEIQYGIETDLTFQLKNKKYVYVSIYFYEGDVYCVLRREPNEYVTAKSQYLKLTYEDASAIEQYFQAKVPGYWLENDEYETLKSQMISEQEDYPFYQKYQELPIDWMNENAVGGPYNLNEFVLKPDYELKKTIQSILYMNQKTQELNPFRHVFNVVPREEQFIAEQKDNQIIVRSFVNRDEEILLSKEWKDEDLVFDGYQLIEGNRFREECTALYGNACHYDESKTWQATLDECKIGYLKEMDFYAYDSTLQRFGWPGMYHDAYTFEIVDQDEDKVIVDLVQLHCNSYDRSSFFDPYYTPIRFENIENITLKDVVESYKGHEVQFQMTLRQNGEKYQVESIKQMTFPPEKCKTKDEYLSIYQVDSRLLPIFNVSGEEARDLFEIIFYSDAQLLDVREDENTLEVTLYFVLNYAEWSVDLLTHKDYYVQPRTFVLDKKTLEIIEK